MRAGKKITPDIFERFMKVVETYKNGCPAKSWNKRFDELAELLYKEFNDIKISLFIGEVATKGASAWATRIVGNEARVYSYSTLRKGWAVHRYLGMSIKGSSPHLTNEQKEEKNDHQLYTDTPSVGR